MKIKVEWEDIAFGLCGNPYHCAVARAIRRRTGADRVFVNCEGIDVGDRELGTPDVVERWLDEFDTSVVGPGDPRPFEFELPIEEVRP